MDINQKQVKNLLQELKKNPDGNFENQVSKLSSAGRAELFCFLLKEDKIPSEMVKGEREIWENLNALFGNNYSKIDVLINQVPKTLLLVYYALNHEILELEDFRTVVRYFYINLDEDEDFNKQVYTIVLQNLQISRIEPPILPKFNEMIRFLGIDHSLCTGSPCTA